MRLALVLNPLTDSTLRLAKQIGVTDIVGSLPTSEKAPVWELLPLLRLKNKVEDAGLKLTVMEGSPPMEKARLGLPGRDEEIACFCHSLRNLGQADIRIVCYNFMAGLGWMRTSTSTRGRGGARVTSFDYDLIKDAPPTKFGTLAEDQLWENYIYFMEKVLPVAEEAQVKLALHPDDPPVSPIFGIARLFTHVEAFDRALEIAPSEVHGITFCQGCFAEMGADIPKTIHHFGEQGKIFFAHFRNIRGDARKFEETFHEEGETDMFAAMRAYHEVGFEGPIRPDHVPEMEGDPDDRPGYTIQGRLYAVGYMKGLMDAVDAITRSSS
ncbi:MAG TPA: mannonate dehydratase [Desulfobacterales bacterium]|nr:mannonate dehydratase [Desulfobacterales bacterium]